MNTRNTIGDRLVPTRANNNWQVAFHMKTDEGTQAAAGDAAGRDRSIYRAVLENEVLKSGIEDPRELQSKKRRVLTVRFLPSHAS